MKNDIALAAAIMTYEDTHLEKMYYQLRISGIVAFEMVASIAEEFVESTKDLDWEDFMEDPTKYGYPHDITDYQDCCIHFYNKYLETNKI